MSLAGDMALTFPAGQTEDMEQHPLAEYIRERSTASRRETAAILGVTEKTVSRLTAAGKITPARRLNRHRTSPLLFDLRDVLLLHLERAIGGADDTPPAPGDVTDQDDQLTFDDATTGLPR